MNFKQIIQEQREELEDIQTRERLIDREMLKAAKPSIKHPNILAVIGVRRCGKSIFSYLLAQNKNFGYVNFDDERLLGLKTEGLNSILEAIYSLSGDVEYIILDEVQNIPGWELFANRLRRTKKVIVTGSNSNLLAGELATHITGRYIDVTLHPFSFREYLDFKKFKMTKVYTTKTKAKLLNLLERYMTEGGFPEINKFGRSMLPRIYQDIITKDIIARYRIHKKGELKQLAKYLVSNVGNEISYRKLSNILGVKHVSTISNWVSYLRQAFLFMILERFDFKLKQQFIAPKKVYCVDNGLVRSMGFGVSKNIGTTMENLVAIELSRRKASDPNLEIYYWKDHQQKEVDFVLKKGPKVRELIQVTFANNKHEVKERETKALLKASKALKSNLLRIVTWDYEDEFKVGKKKITCIPLWTWLLK